MKKENNENLNKLLAGFFDAQTASKTAEDIVSGERIFDSNPAPQPAPALLADIKGRMTIAAAGKSRRKMPRLVWELTAAAAAIVAVIWAGMVFIQQSDERGQFAQVSEAFWQDVSDPQTALDSLATMLDEKESITQVFTFESSASGDTTVINDVTNELDEIETSFWEG
jgi:hypothetical protein